MRQVPGYSLWVGHVGDVRDLRSLLSAGILAVVDLALNEPPARLTRELVYCRFPLVDGAGNPPWLVRAAVETIAGLLRSRTPTLVYCGAGMSRSPMIAAAAVARLRGCSLADALAVVLQSGPADVSPGLLSDVRTMLGRSVGPRTEMPNVIIQASNPASPDARKLVEKLDDYLTALYPAESNHLLSIDALREPNVTFLTATVDGQVGGCGAFVNQDSEYAEVKRIFVLPQLRGLKLGRRILDELESLARAAGLTLARLETGVWQPEALLLFERAGYQRRGPFGEYPDDPLSVFMEKRLA